MRTLPRRKEGRRERREERINGLGLDVIIVDDDITVVLLIGGNGGDDAAIFERERERRYEMIYQKYSD